MNKLFCALNCSVFLSISTIATSSAECVVSDTTTIDVTSHIVIHDFEKEHVQGCSRSFGPSGIVYHSGLERLIVISDKDGQYAMMKTDGSDLVCKTITDINGNALRNRDHEAVTYANSEDGYIYVGLENGEVNGVAYIRQVNLLSSRVEKTWKIKFPGGVVGNKGLESLTFVSDKGHSEGGSFVVGDQTAGKALSNCELPIKSGGDTNRTYECRSEIDPSFKEVSGLDFVVDAKIMEQEGVVFVSSDKDNKIKAYSADGQFLNWMQELPSTGQEGHSFADCTLFISSDKNKSSKKVHRYNLK